MSPGGLDKVSTGAIAGVLALLVAFPILPQAGIARAGDKEVDAKLAIKLLGEWHDERSRLVSGLAVVKDTALEVHPRTRQRVQSKTEFATAFDWKEKSFRFDRRYGEFGGQFIRTPAGTLNRRLPDGSPIVGPPEGKANEYAGAFDIRSIGMVTAAEQTVLNPTLDDIRDWFTKKRKLEEVTAVGEGRYRIRWVEEATGTAARITVWLNRSRGGTAEEMQVLVRDADAPEWRLASQTITEWTEVDGVYVPARWEESRFLPKYGTARHTLTVEWKKVNRPIDMKLFGVEALDNVLAISSSALKY